MYWKVYNVQTGQIIKAGLRNEEKARDWLATHRTGREENYLAEEMDDDEIEEWKAEASDDDLEEAEKAVEVEDEEEEDFEKGRYTYTTEADDGDDGDDELLNEVDDDGDDE